VLELFHGPTLAFKDVAMQLLGRLMDHVLRARGARATIVGATSGDTGSAAVEAFSGLDQVDVFILYPHGRVSDVQRRQMTGVDAANVHTIALEGTFDDCQAIVKALFNHAQFRDELRLSGVSSISWARIAAQTVYYFTAAVALGAPHRPVAFSVPTGNFGNIFAGYAAHRIGLPIAGLVIATNVNDILHRTMETGRYEVRGVTATSAPSMDIQVSSNFERLVFEAEGRNPVAVRHFMGSLGQSGAFSLTEDAHGGLRPPFRSGSVDEPTIAATIARTLSRTGELVDPHTAVAIAVAERHLDRAPMVTLATAHPAKFPDAVEAACGIRPDLPDWARAILAREERYDVLPAKLREVEAAIEARLGAAATLTS